MEIRPYIESDEQAVVALWREVFGYKEARNDPAASIRRKLAVQRELFFVARIEGELAGTIMAGYDGHRGWLYAIAVHPDCRRTGLGSRLVRHAEQALASLGCMKINLQLLASNEATAAFYKSLGYTVEPRISMGKVFHENVSPHGVA